MTTFETAIIWALVMSPFVIPLIVFFTVKLATGAFFRTRQRFYQEYVERKARVKNDNERET